MLTRPEHQRALIHRKVLMDEFARRKKRNSNYSLRAFSRDVGIGLTTLSEVLLKKRSLSRKNVDRLLKKIVISPEQKTRMLSLHLSGENLSLKELEEDQFQLISSWYYFAILNLACIPNVRADVATIADRIGITVIEADNALERLVRLGLVKIEKKRLVRTSVPLHFSSKTPSVAIRQYHRENLELAMNAIEEVPMEFRELTSITVPADLSRLEEAKKQMNLFKQRMALLLEGEDVSEVYTLALQLFPVTRRKPLQ